jgi:hypothetical protein
MDPEGVNHRLASDRREQNVEGTAVEHLLEALRIVADDDEEAAPGSDSGEFEV